jgi:hypothetical protein
MRNEASVVIDRPIDEVFRLTIEHVAEWSIIVVEDEVIDEMPDGVGTTFRTVTEDKGRRMEFRGVVTKHDPPHTHAIHLTGDMFDIETAYVFEDLSGRTRVTQFADVTGKGFFKWFMLLFGWMMNKSHCKASDNELNSLKRFCEQQPVPASH